MADFPELLSQDSQDCTLLKTQTGGNNVPAGLSSAKVKTADFTSSMLYTPALTPESRQHFQSFLPFLAVAPPLLQLTKRAVYQAPIWVTKYRSAADDPFSRRIGLERTIKECMDPSLAKCSRTLESVLRAYQMFAEKETLLVANMAKHT